MKTDSTHPYLNCIWRLWSIMSLYLHQLWHSSHKDRLLPPPPTPIPWLYVQAPPTHVIAVINRVITEMGSTHLWLYLQVLPTNIIVATSAQQSHRQTPSTHTSILSAGPAHSCHYSYERKMKICSTHLYRDFICRPCPFMSLQLSTDHKDRPPIARLYL